MGDTKKGRLLDDERVAHEARRVPEGGKYIDTRELRVFLQDIVALF
jgi:hypothetical protein